MGVAINPMGVSIANYTNNLISELVKITNDDFEIFLIDFFTGKIIEDISPEDNLVPIMKQVNMLSFSKILMRQTIYSGKLQSKIIEKKIDVVHVPFLGRPAPPIPLAFSKVKVVVTNHGMANLALPKSYFYRKNDLARKMFDFTQVLQWHLIKDRLATIITVSHSEKYNIAKNLNISLDKIRVIYHGVSDEFRPISDKRELEETFKKYGVNQPYIFHLSAYQPKKNLVGVLKAFAVAKKKYRIPDRLVIGGKQPTIIKDITKSLNIQDDVIFTGFIANKDLPKLYSGAKFFIFPSFHESFGLPILEAMASGTPVITSNVFSLRELGEGVALLVNPYNLNEIAEAMYTLSVDNVLRRKLRNKGLKKAQEFSWEVTAKKHLKVYQEALAS
ncbi:glycosyltransferase family 1 protein [Thermococcus sp. LS1]|uniref:glycosyltransferase family 4 protein n=1 Tax=Thermococcus sp. LS1 TaxID=1638259 RepID=UPI00143BBF7A